MTAGCSIRDERVCLGRADFDGECIYCIRVMARDQYRRGHIAYATYRKLADGAAAAIRRYLAVTA